MNRRSRGWMAAAAMVALVLLLVAQPVDQRTNALFTRTEDVGAAIAAKRLFPGTRTTTAFDVVDASGGSATDGSSETAFAGDGRTFVSSAWSSSFAGGRYLDLDLNDPLPAGLAISSVDLRLTWASATPGSTACVYIEVRRISSGAVLDTLGGPGAPLDCVTGTALVTTNVSLAAIGTSNLANDARIRLFVSDSAGGPIVIDRATLVGDTTVAPFTLYAVRILDAADTTPATTVWGLDGP